MFSAFLGRWAEVKAFLERVSEISMDAWHVILGVALFLAFAQLARRPVSTWTPWLGVLAVVLLNEILDLHVELWPDRGHQWAEGVKDVVVTMFVPTLLMVTARVAPGLYQPGRNCIEVEKSASLASGAPRRQ